MIYIFEDRHERIRQHQDIIDRYKNAIRFAKFDIDEGMNLTDYIFNNFVDAEIMIIHKSYSFKNNTVNIDVIKKEMQGVRFVVFSGGTDNGTIVEDGNSVTINADVMYANIEIFLKKYLTNEKEINFESLIWGERYMQNRLLSLQNRLFREYFINTDLDMRIEDNDKGIEIDDLLDEIQSYGVNIQYELKEEIASAGDGLTCRDLLQIIRKHIAI